MGARAACTHGQLRHPVADGTRSSTNGVQHRHRPSCNYLGGKRNFVDRHHGANWDPTKREPVGLNVDGGLAKLEHEHRFSHVEFECKHID